MTHYIVKRLEQWKTAGLIDPEQYATIGAITKKERFSVQVELNILLYLGVLSLVGGVEWTVQERFRNLGDAAILGVLTTALGACFYYCLSRGLPFSPGPVESPNSAFDYVLYLGCLLFAVEAGFLELRFEILKNEWDYYLLFLSLLFFVLAYRFDNRFVLSLALSCLASWFGIRSSRFSFFSIDATRTAGIVYSAAVIAGGAATSRMKLKERFLETYLHIAANVLFVALLSGVMDREASWVYLPALLGAAAVAIALASRFRRFAFVAYATLYAYAGLSSKILRSLSGDTAVLGYLVVSGTIVTLGLVLLARRLGRTA